MRRWLIYSDSQVPYQDQKAIDLVTRFGVDIGITDVAHVGDEIDAPSPSRWTRGRAGEFAHTLQRDIDATRKMLAGIVDAIQPDEAHLMRSNHGDRVRNYISEKAPALAPLRALEWADLMGFEDLGWTYHTKPYEFSKGFVLAHGDEGSLSKVPGSTAMGLVRKWGGVSVFCGHTHRLGMQHENFSLNGKVTKHRFGIEVGHTMALSKASYLSALSANWQSGFGLLEVDDAGVGTPYAVPIVGGKIRWGGEVWS